jgi:mRNA interferase MazF
MPLKYLVAPGTIVLCDYDTGFREPEMVKRRPVVVISPRLPHRDNLCTVVPLSSTPPQQEFKYQCRIELSEELPAPFSYRIWWTKADMLATVGLARLDLFRTERDQTGKRKYIHPKVTPGDFARIKACILFALGMGDLTSNLSDRM